MWRETLLNRIVSIASTAALVAAVIVAPIRAHNALATTPVPRHPHDGFVHLPPGSVQTTSKSSPTSALRVKAISTEREGEEKTDCDSAPSSYLVAVPHPCASFEPSREAIPTCLVRAIRPLRC
jgi:hypothetical protein